MTLLQAALALHKHPADQRVGLLDLVVQPGDQGLQLARRDHVVEVHADIHQDEFGSHVHGEDFVDPYDPFVARRDGPDPLHYVVAGALSDQADIRLTPLSNQGLAGMLPLGWSPLAAVDVRLLDPAAGTALYTGFSSAVALKVPVQVPLAQASGAVLTLAAYDSTSHQWLSKGNATIAADGLSASADITAAGQYALLIADPAPNAPAATEAGNPLAPASTASFDYAAINTAGKVVPQASPPSTVVDLSRLDYLDSSGLGLLLSLSKEYAATGGKLVLVTNETVDNILSLTRLNGIFATAPQMEQALQMVEAPTV